MTSQRELFPRLTADMRRFKKLPPLLHRDPADPSASSNSRSMEPAELGGGGGGGGGGAKDTDPWEEHRAATAASPEASESTAPVGILASLIGDARGLLYPFAPFPLLNSEVLAAEHHIQASVEQAMGHCRRDTLWRRLFHGEQLDLVLDKLKLTKLSFCELEELLEMVVSRSIGEIDPQLVKALLSLSLCVARGPTSKSCPCSLLDLRCVLGI